MAITKEDIALRLDSIENVVTQFIYKRVGMEDKTTLVNIYPVLEKIRREATLDMLFFYNRYSIDPIKGIDTLKLASFYLYHLIKERVGRISGVQDITSEIAFQTMMFYVEEQCEKDRKIYIEVQEEAAQKAIKFIGNRTITSETIYFMFHLFRNANTNTILPSQPLG